MNDEVFFTQHELDDLTDHYFVGEVDEYGQFHGRCRIFDVEYPDLKIDLLVSLEIYSVVATL